MQVRKFSSSEQLFSQWSPFGTGAERHSHSGSLLLPAYGILQLQGRCPHFVIFSAVTSMRDMVLCFPIAISLARTAKKSLAFVDATPTASQYCSPMCARSHSHTQCHGCIFPGLRLLTATRHLRSRSSTKAWMRRQL